VRVEIEKTGKNRNKQGKFVKGFSGNTKGRPPETLEEKMVKKASKEIVSEYKERLTEVLPKLSVILINKALEGDMQAIKELHDRAMGKPHQQTNITSDDKPIPIIQIDRAIVKTENKET
jgi:hypothetical protein